MFLYGSETPAKLKLASGFSFLLLEKIRLKMSTVLLAIAIVGAAFALIALRILLVKGGEFRGTCATNNPMLKNEIGECTVCGATPGEECKGEK